MPIAEDYDEPETFSQEYSTGEAQIQEIRDSFISKITSTGERTRNLWYQLRGYAPDGKGNWKKGRELCGEEFANKTVAEFSSIVNDTNPLTRKNAVACKRILHDAIETFVMDALHDETVSDNDVFVLANIFSNNLELFLGLVEFGHGSKVISAIMTGQKLDFEEKTADNTFMEYLRGKK